MNRGTFHRDVLPSSETKTDKMKQNTIRLFLILIAVIILSHAFSACTFSAFSKKSYKNAVASKPYDVIIVPGLPYDKEKTSSVMKMRMFWAKYLYDSGFTRNIIFSGGAVYTPFVESIAMKVMADSLGIPSKYTFSETEAEHSTENVYYSWKKAKGLGFRKIAVATDPFQASMLRGFIRKHTPGVDIIPIIYDKIDVENRELPRIDTTSSYRRDFVSIKEREGFFERFRNTMGKRIKEEKKLEEARKKAEGEVARN
jgi:uncharacterized SAM-binding protein YcdF (DUF218 family)